MGNLKNLLENQRGKGKVPKKREKMLKKRHGEQGGGNTVYFRQKAGKVPIAEKKKRGGFF